MSAIGNILATKIMSFVAGTAPSLVTTSATVASDTTFGPDGQVSPGVFQWVDRSGGIPVGYPRYTFSMRRPQRGGSKYRILERFVFPVLNVTSPQTGSGIQPQPSVAFNLSKETTWTIDQSATEEQKKTFYSLARSLDVANIYASDGTPTVATSEVVTAAVVNGEPPFSV